MDCPKAIISKTTTSDLKMEKSKKFIIKDEKGKNHEIEFGVSNESIIFKSEINNGIITKKYSNIYSFDKLKQNKVFTFQDNIEEIYEQIEMYTKDEPVSLKVDEKNIIINCKTKIKKYPEIIFELKPEVIDNNKIINILIDKINNLEVRVNSLELKNKDLELENKSLKIIINQINEYINEKKEKDRKKKLNFYDSLIVKEDEIKMINNWINPNTNVKAKLLYRASRDGQDSYIFHKYCDNKGPTIMFAKINNGYRFGGFSGISWINGVNKWVKDKDSFLFSLNNKLKIMNNNTNYTVWIGNGPDFGDSKKNELLFSYNCLTGKNNFCNDSGSAFTFRNKDLVGVDVKGEYYFDVEDFEVYSIQY